MLEIGMPSPTVPLAKKAKPAPLEIEGANALAPSEPLEGTVEPLELVKIEPANALELFTITGALKPILDRLAGAGGQ